MRYLKDLKRGERVNEVYLCKVKQTLQAKTGKSYFSLTLQDKTGTFDGKVWDINSPGIDEFDSMDYVRVDGEVVEFQGALQLKITRLSLCVDGDYYPEDYMPCSSKDIEQMYADVLALIGTVKNKHLKALAEEFFVKDKDFVKKFKSHSAAKSIHHGFIGGLLEHTLSVATTCDFLAKMYPVVNRDLLIIAAIFHDLGKVKEISEFPENDYTDDGQLLGHIYIGAEMVSKMADSIEGFPAKLKSELLHCILAHHGELEFGSPKKPAIIEAVILSQVDNLDAKVETMTEIFNNTEDNGWLGYQKLFESNVRKTSK